MSDTRLVWETDKQIIFSIVAGRIVYVDKERWHITYYNTFNTSIIFPSVHDSEPKRHFLIRNGVVEFCSDDGVSPNQKTPLTPLQKHEVEDSYDLLPDQKQTSQLIVKLKEGYLSKNFTVAEFCKSSTATRLGIDNSLPQELYETAKNTARKILQPVRDHYDIGYVPNSCYRGLVLNSVISSSKTSQHLKAEAADYEIPGIANEELFQWCAKELDYDQLILEFHDPADPASGWVHASTLLDASKNRKMAFKIEA